jgi:Flp pilus assembly pilin Flp
MSVLVTPILKQDSGQDIIEYALLAALLSTVSWSVIASLQGDVQILYRTIAALVFRAAAAV